jgi:hypothetical protein
MRMKKILFSLMIVLLNIALISSQTTLIATDTKQVLKAAGSYLGGQFGYVTEDGLYTIYNDIKTLNIKADYVLNNQNFTTSFVNNIKEISCDGGGRIYVTTFDDHIVMMEKGKVYAGLPLKSNDLHLNFDGYVCTNLFLNDNWYVAELLDNPMKFDDMFASNTYPLIQSELNMVKPDELSINEQALSVVTAENKKDIAYIDGTKLVWQKSPGSFLPCSEIVDITSSRISFIGIQGVHYQVYTVCETGEVWVWTRKIGNNNDLNLPFTSAEWKRLNLPSISPVKELTHADRNYLVGSIDGGQNSLFVHNIQKNAFCLINLPGSAKVRDFFFSPYESLGVVAKGNQVYAVDIDPDDCQQSTSSIIDGMVPDHEPYIYPNPSYGSINIFLPAYAEAQINCTIVDVMGNIVANQTLDVTDGRTNLNNIPHSGIYVLHLKGKAGYHKVVKCIIH